MSWLIAALTLVLALRVIQVFLSLANRSGASLYTRYVSLFSPAEMAFMRVLDRAVGHHYRIFAKIRVADVIDLRPDLDRRSHRRAFNRIRAKHFDFVLCNPRDFSITGVIELNDASHLLKKRARRDAFLIDICNDIGLPILMVRARHSYSAFELRSVIEKNFYD